MIPLWAAATAVVVAVCARWARRHRPGEATVALAHTARVADTERFGALRRRQLSVTVARAGFVAVALIGVAGVTARPTESRMLDPEARSRDVLLCLDVSDSMDVANVAVLESFIDLARQLEGDRIGLVIFHAVAVPKFPLTDDLAYAVDQLTVGRDAIDTVKFDWTRATFPPGTQAGSLLADGLAACTQRFDRLDEDRPRSIVFATDNEPLGGQVFRLEDAFGLAADAGIRVYSINPSAQTPSFEDLTRSTGGRYWQVDNPADAIGGIVDDVLAQEASLLDDGTAGVVVGDRPQFWIALAALGVIGLLAVARWQR